MSIEFALQQALYALLTADPALRALINGRVYDRAPKDVEFPYVSFGPSDDDEENLTGVDAGSTAQQIDVWSQDGAGAEEAKRIGGAIRNALHLQDMDLVGGSVILMQILSKRHLSDPDGVTTHGIIVVGIDFERD